MNVVFRDAAEADLPAIVAVLADDVLGQGRESTRLDGYRARWREIASDPNNHLIVGCLEDRIVAAYQLTIIPGFTLNATRRAEIEGVRVAADLRGEGAGAALLSDAEARARRAGAGLMQLTMNLQRDDAQRFYERNGFEPSHVGFKKVL